MASLNKDNKGWKISFRDPTNKKQKSIRPGSKLSKKSANEIKTRVEYLISAKASNLPLDTATATWVSGLVPDMQTKLHHAGLIEKPELMEVPLLGEFLENYIDSRTDVKPRTITNLKAAARELLNYFGENKALEDINEGDADDFWRQLIERMGENTARRRCGRAKQFFKAAIKKRFLDYNPFAELKTNVQANPKRFHFISREVAGKILEACPSAEWRLLFALARYGGLRVPSEIRPLKWEDIHWQQNRITITSPKTAHHQGGDSRVIPIFPELRPCLDEMFELAADGAVYVFSKAMREHTNPATTLKKIIKRAGESIWEKTFQNLRSTRQTELEEQFPSHVVCSWIGNSVQVAKAHYLQITDEHFTRAAMIGPRSGGNQGGNTGGNISSHLCTSSEIKKPAQPCIQGLKAGSDGSGGVQDYPVRDSNYSLETSVLQSETEVTPNGGNQGGNISGDCPRLQALAAVWDDLPEMVQVEILRLAHEAVHG